MTSFYLKVRFKLRNEEVDKEKIFHSIRDIVDYLWELDFPPDKIYIEKLNTAKKLTIAKERTGECKNK